MKNIENWNFLYIKIRQNGYVARDFGSCCNHGEHLHRGHHGTLCIWQSNSRNCKFFKSWRSFELFHFSREIEDESWQTIVNFCVFTNFYALSNLLIFFSWTGKCFSKHSIFVSNTNEKFEIFHFWRSYNFSPIFSWNWSWKLQTTTNLCLCFHEF